MGKMIILDGVGINFKTSILDRFLPLGWVILKSNSYIYTPKIADLFPGCTLYSRKILHRYIEMKQTLDMDMNVIVDRGMVNQLIWCKMARERFIDCYPYDEQDMDNLLRNEQDILDLDREFDPIKILIKTSDRRLIEKCFQENDFHADQRKEVFYSVDGYFETQDRYIELYRQMVPNHYILEIDDTRCSIETKINKLVLEIISIYEQLTLDPNSY